MNEKGNPYTKDNLVHNINKMTKNKESYVEKSKTIIMYSKVEYHN